MSIDDATPEDWDNLRTKYPAMMKKYEDLVQIEATKDNVNSPSHYTQGKIECIDAIQESMSTEAFLGYCKGNTIKYLWRSGLKNESPSEDLLKARWYLEKWIDNLGKQ